LAQVEAREFVHRGQQMGTNTDLFDNLLASVTA
jgi:hypothetical protein